MVFNYFGSPREIEYSNEGPIRRPGRRPVMQAKIRAPAAAPITAQIAAKASVQAASADRRVDDLSKRVARLESALATATKQAQAANALVAKLVPNISAMERKFANAVSQLATQSKVAQLQVKALVGGAARQNIMMARPVGPRQGFPAPRVVNITPTAVMPGSGLSTEPANSRDDMEFPSDEDSENIEQDVNESFEAWVDDED